MLDTSLSTKRRLTIEVITGSPPDLLLYGGDGSPRSQLLANAVRKKYGDDACLDILAGTELPNGRCRINYKEAISRSKSAVGSLVSHLRGNPHASVGVDISGMPDAYIYEVFYWLYRNPEALSRVKIYYIEPRQYVKNENTEFLYQSGSVSPVPGFTCSNHSTETDSDLLILSCGYDRDLQATVVHHKEHARKKLPVVAYPSMAPHMYHECVIRSSAIIDAIGSSRVLLVRAYDPVAFYTDLHPIITEHALHNPLANIYISALGPKPHALGSCLLWKDLVLSCRISLITPAISECSRSSSIGHGRIWEYRLKFKA